jgi:hypothetical protein
MIANPGTGHAFAPDGHLLRVDVIAGQWVASDPVVVFPAIGLRDRPNRRRQWRSARWHELSAPMFCHVSAISEAIRFPAAPR